MEVMRPSSMRMSWSLSTLPASTSMTRPARTSVVAAKALQDRIVSATAATQRFIRRAFHLELDASRMKDRAAADCQFWARVHTPDVGW
jgi:hypothetical protein